MKAIGYIRRSKKAEDNTISLLEQERQVREYCSAMGFECAAIVAHNGVSGANRGRWLDINTAVVLHAAKAIVVYNLDRLSRDAVGLLENLRLMALAGLTVHEVGQGPLDLRQAAGKLSIGVRGLVDEFFRDVIKQKTTDAIRYRKDQGRRYCHHAPFGSRWEGGRIVEDVEEQRALKLMQSARALGLGVQSTVRFLRHHDYRGRLSTMTVYRCMKNIEKQVQEAVK